MSEGAEWTPSLSAVGSPWKDLRDTIDHVPPHLAAAFEELVASHHVVVVVCDDDDAHRSLIRAAWTALPGARWEVANHRIQRASDAGPATPAAAGEPDGSASPEVVESGVSSEDGGPAQAPASLHDGATLGLDRGAGPAAEVNLTLDLLARCGGEDPASIVVWAGDPAQEPFLEFLSWDGARCLAVARELQARERRVIVLSRASNLPERLRNPYEEKLRPLRWEREALVAPVQNGPDARQMVAELFQACFDAAELKAFLLEYLSGNLASLVLTGTHAAACVEAADHLKRHGLLKPALFELLRARRPNCLQLVEDCRLRVAAREDFDRERRAQLDAEIGRLCPPRERGAWPPVFELDAVAVMLHQRLTPAQWRTFVALWRVARWGTVAEGAIRDLRTVVRGGQEALEAALAQEAGQGEHAPDALRKLDPVEQMLVFVATFLPGLRPDEFQAVTEGLLQLEQAHLDAVLPAPADADAPPPPTLVQRWQAEADNLLEACGLEIREVQEADAKRLEVVWRALERQRWMKFFQHRRHYFFARQVEHLRDFRFLTIPSEGEQGAFRKILALQLDHAEVSPAHDVRRWIAGLDELVQSLVSYLEAGQQELEDASGKARTVAERASVEAAYRALSRLDEHQLLVKRRLVEVLEAMQRRPTMRPVVQSVFRNLLKRGEAQASALAYALAMRLAGNTDFDPMPWYRQLYCGTGGAGSAFKRHVLDAAVGYALSAKPDLHGRAWAALGEWFPKELPLDAFLKNPTWVLAFDTQLNTLRSLALPTGNLAQLEAAVGGWLRAPSGEPPAPVRWLTDARIAELAERYQRGCVVRCLGYALLPPWEIPDSVRSATATTFDSEVALRLELELAERAAANKATLYAYLSASVLALWCLRLGGERLRGVSEVLARFAPPELLEISATLSAMDEALRAGREALEVAARTPRDPLDSGSKEVGPPFPPAGAPFPDFYERQLTAVAHVRAQVEELLEARLEDSNV